VRGRRQALAALASALVALACAATVAGDTTPPQITIIAPKTGTIYDQQLRIEASASDPDGLGLITFKADGRSIKSFVSDLQNGRAVSLDWRRARELSPGEHTITVEAVDKQGSNAATGGSNSGEASVTVRRVPASTLTKARTRTTITLAGSGLRRTVRGRVSAPAVSFPREAFPLTGRIGVVWEIFSYGRWKVRHRGTADAAAPYRVSQRLAQKGRWRVRVSYDPEPPYAASASKTLTFTASK
jgi:hypothetical protein